MDQTGGMVGRIPATSRLFTQSGIAVDRFAREIGAILISSRAARSRQLNAKTFGGASLPVSCYNADVILLLSHDQVLPL